MDPFAFFKIAPNLTWRDAQPTEAADGTSAPGLTADDGGDGFAQLVSGSVKPTGQSLPPATPETAAPQTEAVGRTGEDAPAEAIQVLESGRAQYWRNLLGAGEGDARGSAPAAYEPQEWVDSPVDRAAAEASSVAGEVQVAAQTTLAASRAAPPPALSPIVASAIDSPTADQGAEIAPIAPDDEPPRARHSAGAPSHHAVSPIDARTLASPPAPVAQHTNVISDAPGERLTHAAAARDSQSLPPAQDVAANRVAPTGARVPVEGAVAPNRGSEIALENSGPAQNTLGSITPEQRVPPATIGSAQVSAPESEARPPVAGSSARSVTNPSPTGRAQDVAAEVTSDRAQSAGTLVAERGATSQSPVARATEGVGKDAIGKDAIVVPDPTAALPKRQAPEPATHPAASETLPPSGEAARGRPADWTAVPAAVAEALTESGSVISITARSAAPVLAPEPSEAAATAPSLPVAPRTAGATPAPDLVAQAVAPTMTAEEESLAPAHAGKIAERNSDGRAVLADTAPDQFGATQTADSAAVASPKTTIETFAANPVPSQVPRTPEQPADVPTDPEALTPSQVSQGSVTRPSEAPSSAQTGTAAAPAGPGPAAVEEIASTPEPRANDRRDRREDRIEGAISTGGNAPDKPMQATAQVDGSAARSGQIASGSAAPAAAAAPVDASASVSPSAPSFAPQVGGSTQAPVPTSVAASAPPPPALQIATAVASEGPSASHIDVSLSPEELGHVRLRLAHGEAGLSVTITADRPETLDLLRRNIETLARDFQDIGYGDVNFSFGDQPRQERPIPSADRGFSPAQPDFLTERDPDPTAPLHPQSRLPDGGLDLRI